ncbi:hypothetical protein BHE74_00046229 [Ensete ventricosum]|nr:hypothetical protein BHE74_00046229 [Ensete ventricosum]RZS25314.1 hypothetical protein BHM03_00058507 [Ensete ventricosum]
MESDSVDYVSLTDGLDDEEVTQHRHPFPKPHGGGAPPLPGIAPTTSVHELLECPVCTNSMYPPIHQVGISYVGILSRLQSDGDRTISRLCILDTGFSQ